MTQPRFLFLPYCPVCGEELVSHHDGGWYEWSHAADGTPLCDTDPPVIDCWQT